MQVFPFVQQNSQILTELLGKTQRHDSVTNQVKGPSCKRLNLCLPLSFVAFYVKLCCSGIGQIAFRNNTATFLDWGGLKIPTTPWSMVR